ncbi:MAG: bifunctional anthranilate synthase component II/anthranilate phosphoribosyltransferase [Spirochaetaceae bacterium]
MILLIDNYDSFTHNLYQYLREITSEEVRVLRNDAVTVEEVRDMQPDHIIISPGPGRPEEAGVSVPVVRELAGSVPILGVCLGHQAVAAAFDAKVVSARRIVHGKVEEMSLDGRGLFRSIDSPAGFTRYHSLAVEEESLPPELEITARSPDGEIMGVRHREHVVEGVQFHPESIASDQGKKLLRNFLHYHRRPFVPREALSALLDGRAMSREEAENFMEELTEGNLTNAQIAGFLTAVNAAGITPEEIAGCATVLQRKRIPIRPRRPVLDTCGTGGDGLGTFNISSLVALVASAGGASVAKHGNRAVSSKSGSADFYRALGVNVDLPPAASEALLHTTDFAFLYAPLYHGAMKHAAVPRRELGVKTIMNLLGPLVNPAGASYQLIGVFDDRFAEPVARAAHMLGIRRGMVVHGRDGLDEISVSAATRIVAFDEEGTLKDLEVEPEELGVARHPLSALRGGDAGENARVAREVMAGRGPEAVRDAVLANAGAALSVYGLAADIPAGVEQARALLERGAVAAKLDEVVAAGDTAMRRAS